MRAPDFIRDRAKAGRRALTPSERQLWYLLRRNALGLHFRREHPVGPFLSRQEKTTDGRVSKDAKLEADQSSWRSLPNELTLFASNSDLE